MKHPKPDLSWVAPGVASSTLFTGLPWLAQLAVFSGIDEAKDFRDRGIRIGEAPHFGEALGENARAVKQPLIERPDRREPLARELATLHADDVEAGERGELAAR